MNHDEIDENNWRVKKSSGYLMLEMMFSVLLNHTLDIVNQRKK